MRRCCFVESRAGTSSTRTLSVSNSRNTSPDEQELLAVRGAADTASPSLARRVGMSFRVIEDAFVAVSRKHGMSDQDIRTALAHAVRSSERPGASNGEGGTSGSSDLADRQVTRCGVRCSCLYRSGHVSEPKLSAEGSGRVGATELNPSVHGCLSSRHHAHSVVVGPSGPMRRFARQGVRAITPLRIVSRLRRPW